MKWKIKLNFPFKWQLKLKFSILPNQPTPCIIKGNKWMRMLNGIPVIVEGKDNLLYFYSPKKTKEIENLVFKYHGIKNPKNLYDFMEKDSILRKIKRELHGFGRAGLMSISVYEGIIKAIVQQQISLKIANHIISNIVKKYGMKTKYMNELVYDFPLPHKLASAKIEELRKCGLSYRKAEYIKNFSQEVLNGFDPEKLRNKKPEEIFNELTSFKGIGKWTAELVMAASIGLNIIPTDDLGVRKAISYFYFDELQPPTVIKEFVKKFGKYKRDIVVYLLMAYRLRKFNM